MGSSMVSRGIFVRRGERIELTRGRFILLGCVKGDYARQRHGCTAFETSRPNWFFRTSLKRIYCDGSYHKVFLPC